MDPDLQIRGGGGGGGGRSSRTWDKGRGAAPKKSFSVLPASFWSKKNAGEPGLPGSLPWICYCNQLSNCTHNPNPVKLRVMHSEGTPWQLTERQGWKLGASPFHCETESEASLQGSVLGGRKWETQDLFVFCSQHMPSALLTNSNDRIEINIQAGW